MRLFFAALYNVVLLLLGMIAWPFRLLRVRRRPRYVRFRLHGDIPYRAALAARRRWRRTRRLEAAQVTALDGFAEELELLGRDPRLKGIVLEVEDVQLPPAKIATLHRLLASFRAAGKEVVGRAVVAGNAEYELLCAADRILLPKAGRLELTGFAAEATALGRGLSAIGVSPQFVRRGDHKTAPELFTHAEISEAQREMVGALLDERHAALVERIASGRRITPEKAAGAIDAGPYSSRRALAAGLCDEVVEEADLAERLMPRDASASKKGPRPRRQLASFRDWGRTRPWRPERFARLTRRPRVAVVPISGAIVQGEGGRLPLPVGGQSAAGSDAVIRALRAAADDTRAKAAILYVSSPGGSALASELILDEVRRLGEEKPLLAYVDRVAASGGYLAAMGARELWADPHAIVGSIGVFAGKFDLSGLLERVGIRREVMTRGKLAGRLSASRPFTPDERASLEAEVEEIYQDFLETVAKARKRTVAEIHAQAEGRVFSGRRALAVGLIDGLASFEETARRALDLAGVPSGPFELALHRPTGRALGLASLFAQMTTTHAYAFWAPSWSIRPGGL